MHIITDRIEKAIDLGAPVERVWRALTDHREFGAWFRVDIEAPFVAGKPARGRTTHPGYEHVVRNAVIEGMDAPRRFAFSWHPYAVDPDRDYSAEPQTLVEFTLAPTVTGTHLTIVESGFDLLPRKSPGRGVADERRRLESAGREHPQARRGMR